MRLRVFFCKREKHCGGKNYIYFFDLFLIPEEKKIKKSFLLSKRRQLMRRKQSIYCVKCNHIQREQENKKTDYINQSDKIGEEIREGRTENYDEIWFIDSNLRGHDI